MNRLYNCTASNLTETTMRAHKTMPNFNRAGLYLRTKNPPQNALQILQFLRGNNRTVDVFLYISTIMSFS